MKNFQFLLAVAKCFLLLIFISCPVYAQNDMIKEISKPFESRPHIIGSPSLWWDNFEVVKRLSNKSSIPSANLRAVYTYVGGDEGDMMINPLNKFNEFLQIKAGDSIKSHSQVYQGENHMSVIPAAFSTAVRFVYK